MKFSTKSVITFVDNSAKTRDRKVVTDLSKIYAKQHKKRI